MRMAKLPLPVVWAALAVPVVCAAVAPAARARSAVRVSVRHTSLSTARVKVRSPASTHRVTFSVDGHRRAVVRRRPYTQRISTVRMRRGRHVLTVRAHTRSGLVTVRRAFNLSARADSPSGGAGSWTSNFDSGTLDAWSVWSFGSGTGTIENVPSGTDGVPAHSGSRMVKFEVTPEQEASGHVNAKLYKIWTRSGAPRFHEDGTGAEAPTIPSSNDMSGTYSAWFYFPSTYRRSATVPNWTTIWQWKQWFGDNRQIVNWGICVSAASQWGGLKRPDGSPQWNGPYDQRPVMSIQGGSFDHWDYEVRAVPLGRWFRISAVVHQGQSIDWYIDGNPWRTIYNSRFPVGASPIPQDGEDAPPQASIFSVGHYDGIGTDYVDGVSFTPAR